MSQKLVFKNYQLETLYKLLYDLPIKRTESRLRTRFNNLLASHLQLIAQEKDNILLEHAKKDGNGEIVREINEEGKELVTLENRARYVTDIRELENEDFIIEVTAANVKMIQSVTNSLLNADDDGKLSGNDAVIYDSFCLIFEDIDFEAIN